MTEDIIFQVIDWSQFHEGEPLEAEDELDELEEAELLHYKIRLFGRTDKGKSIFVNVDNFTPYFYVEIPTDWNQTKAFSLVNHIKSKIKNPIVLKGFKNFDIVERKKFYGFTGYKTFKFLRLIFLNMKSFKTFEYWIERNKINYPFLFKKPTKLTIYESNIEPFIRCMHIRKLNACGWVSVSKYEEYDEGTAYTELAIRTDWINLNPHDSNSIQKFVVASYDIECMSESGDFPIATNDNDPIIQIGTVFSYYGESEPFFKSIITLGGCKKIKGLEDVEIQSFEDEKKVLLAWTKLIQKHDPDIITGYNINGFDFQYMKDRAEKHKILKRFNQLSRIQGEESEFKVKQLASSALGENILKYFDMNGRVIIDLMKVAMRDFKLDSFKLDNVASTFIREKIEGYKELDKQQCLVTTKSVYGIKEEDYVNIMWDDGLTENKHEQKYKILEIKKDETDPKLYTMKLNGTIPEEAFYTEKHGGTTKKKNKTFWCHAKDDVSAKDLFRFQRGSDEDRGIIAKYCIMDCVLVTKLMEKTQVLNNNIGMANVCSVPLTYIFMRGQGVKIFSLVSKKCRELDHIMPKLKVKQKENPDDKFKKIKKAGDDSDDDEPDDTGYEGAIVFPPVKGVHYEPIPVLDYASLYPRSMILVNISQECFVMEPKYDNLDGYDYQTVTYNNNDGTTTTCRFAKKLDGTKGILPLILIELLDKRSSTKKLMEKAAASGDNFAAAIYDGLQLAYKVTANSLYGQVGAPTSPIYMKELAASTTATGRKMLELSKVFIEGAFGTLINLALESKKKYEEYALEVFDKDVYHKRTIQTKKWVEPKAGRNTKEEFIDYFYKKVIEIIEPDYRVSPQVIYGDSVTADTPILILKENKVNFICISELGKSWTDYSQFKSEDPHLSEKQQDKTINFKVWTDKGWARVIRVIRHLTYKKIYEVITPKGYVKVTSDHSLLDMQCNQIKPTDCKLGQELLHNDIFENTYTQEQLIDNFMMCYNHLGGCTDSEGNHFIEVEYVEDALETYYRAKLAGMFPTIEKKSNTFRIICWKYDEFPGPNTIIEINDLGYTYDYVYDLETEVGHFHAGVGSLIVKNTDSVFFSPKIHHIESKVIRTDRDVLPICIEIGMLAGSTICKVLPEPEEQVYEKTLWPFIILAKKKYVGNLYEDDDKSFKQKSMGIVLKRRDNAKIVKIVVGGIVDYILNGKPGETSVQDRNAGAIEYVRMLIKQILRGEFPIDKYVVSKTLRSTYKNRNGIVHAVLADRIGARDPGNKPDVNERVPYVYIVPKGKVNLQGDRVEDPKYVLENKLELDYLFYITNQIMKPSIQFLELIAHNPEKLFQNYINKEINRRKNVSSIMDYVGEDNVNGDKDEQVGYGFTDSKNKKSNNNTKTSSNSNLNSDDNSTQDLIDELEEIDEPISKSKSKSKSETKDKTKLKTKTKIVDEKPKSKDKTKNKKEESDNESSSSDEEIKKRKLNNKTVKKSLILEL